MNELKKLRNKIKIILDIFLKIILIIFIFELFINVKINYLKVIKNNGLKSINTFYLNDIKNIRNCWKYLKIFDIQYISF